MSIWFGGLKFKICNPGEVVFNYYRNVGYQRVLGYHLDRKSYYVSRPVFTEEHTYTIDISERPSGIFIAIK